jgi:transcriptional regulator with XRE-family HTH domain
MEPGLLKRQRERARLDGVNHKERSRLRQLRRERELSQREVARRTGVPWATVQRTETRSFPGKPDHQRALAKFFRVPVKVLFTPHGWAR